MAVRTPRAWDWQINKSCHQIELRGGGNIIMDFVRYGMNRAAPRFNVDGLLHRADDFAKIIPGREHHASWCQTIENPTALLIAAAPLMLAALKEAYNEDSGGYSAAQMKAAILAAEPDAFDAEGYLR